MLNKNMKRNERINENNKKLTILQINNFDAPQLIL